MDGARSPSLHVRPARIAAGGTVTLIAVLPHATPSGTATSAIRFSDGALDLGTVPVRAGRARLRVRLFSAGTHSLRAALGDDDGSGRVAQAEVVVSASRGSRQ